MMDPVDDAVLQGGRWSAARLRRWVVVSVLTLAAVALALIPLSALLAQGPPGWWSPAEVDEPALLRRAQVLENNVLSAVTEPRPGATPMERELPWRFSINSGAVNAWLGARLPQWLASRPDLPRWPETVRELRAHFHAGVLTLGAHVVPARAEAFWVSVNIVPEVDRDGALWLAARSIQIGRLPIPTGLLIDARGGNGPVGELDQRVPAELRELPETKRLLRVLAGSEPALHAPVLRLGDGRRVRLRGLGTTDDDKLLVHLKTEDR